MINYVELRKQLEARRDKAQEELDSLGDQVTSRRAVLKMQLRAVNAHLESLPRDEELTEAPNENESEQEEPS